MNAAVPVMPVRWRCVIVLQVPEPHHGCRAGNGRTSDGGSKKLYSMEDAMKGVAKQVNGLRDDKATALHVFMKCRMPSRLPANIADGKRCGGFRCTG